MTYNEAVHRRDTAGKYATKVQGAPTISLSAPAAEKSTGLAMQRIEDLGLADALGAEAGAEVSRRVAETLDFSDENITGIANDVVLETRGFSATDFRQAQAGADVLRSLGDPQAADAIGRILASAQGSPAAPRLPDGAAMAGDPRVQAGEVFDEIRTDDGRAFHRRREGVYPGTPSEMRIQANRPLTSEEVRHFAGLVGYSYAANISRDGLPEPAQDSPYSFTVYADTAESRRSDLAMAMEDFETELAGSILEGSRIRPTKGNTRLVAGFNEPDLRFEIYYDDIAR